VENALMKITASCTLNGHALTDIPVINPGGWFGKAWLVEIGGSFTPLFLVVEADSVSDASDELSDDPNFGPPIHVPDADLCDYPKEERRHDGSGPVIDLAWIAIRAATSRTRSSTTWGTSPSPSTPGASPPGSSSDRFDDLGEGGGSTHVPSSVPGSV
jgi:hypothetical protein